MSISGHSVDQTELARLSIAEKERKEWAMIGDGAAMQHLRMQVERFGPYFRMILVRGERGTGKELTARGLHARSEGADGVFIVCHGTMLTDETDRHLSERMKRARRGTLFLDAIDEMSLPAQDRLLVAMEQKRYTRMIASSSKDLRALTASGRFRGSLYHRLAMVEIALEPLRRRAEDIPALAMHFLHRSSESCKKDVTMIADDAMKRLMHYEWPGNVRELEDAVRVGVLECDGNKLEARHLVLVDEKKIGIAPITSACQSMRLQDVVERHVQQVLKSCAGNKVRAAELLGISRSTLYRMLDGGGAIH